MDDSINELKDTGTSNLLSNIFVTLPDMKPDNLSELDYCIFLLFISLNNGIRKCKFINDICIVVLVFQMFAIICLPSLQSIIWKDERYDLFFHALYFSLYLTSDPNHQVISSHLFFYIIDMIGLLSIAIFIYALVVMHQRRCIGHDAQIFIVLFSIILPRIYLLIIINSISINISKLVLKDDLCYVYLTIITLIVFIFLFFIRYITTSTITSSFLIPTSHFMHFSISFYQDCISIILLCLFNYSFLATDLRHANFVMAVGMMTFGILQIVRFSYATTISISTCARTASYGCALIVSSIFGFMKYAGQFQNEDIAIYVFVYISIIIYFVSYKMLHHRNEMLLKNLKVVVDYDHLNIKSMNQFLIYFQVGFTHCVKEMLDGTFVKWGIQTWMGSHLIMRIICLLSIIPGSEKLVEEISSYLPLNSNRSHSEKFAIFQHQSTSHLRIVKAPMPLQLTVIKAERQLDQYRTVYRAFSAFITSKNGDGYLFLDVLATIRSQIRNCIESLRREYPNCAEVLRLYASFLEKIEFDYEGADRLNQLSNSLDSGEIKSVDFQYLNIASMYPKLQTFLLKYSIKGSNDKKFLDYFLEDINPKDIPNKRKLKRSPFIIISIVFMFLLFISVLIVFFGIVSEVIKHSDHMSKLTTFIDSLINSTFSFSTIYYTSLNSIFENKEPKYVHTSLDSFESAGSRILTTFKDIALISDNFNKSFSWMTEKLFTFPSYVSHIKANIHIWLAFARCAESYGNIFPNHTAEKIYVNQYIKTFSFTSEAISECFSLINNSKFSFFMKEKSNLIAEIQFFCLPTLLLSLFGLLLPIFLKLELNALLKHFPQQFGSKEKPFLISFFLEKDFYSFKRIIVHYIITVIAVNCVNISLGATTVKIYNEMSNTLCEHVCDIDVYTRQYLYAASSIGTIYGSILLKETSINIIETLNTSIDYFLKTNTPPQNQNQSVIYHQQFAEFTYQLMKQVSGNSIKFNKTNVESMIGILEGPIINCIIATTIDLRKKFDRYMKSLIEIVLTSNEIFFIICSVLVVLIHKQIQKSQAIIDVAYHLISQIPETARSDSDKITYLQGKGLISPSAELKSISVLDMIDFPCAILDDEEKIVSANRIWLTFFDFSLINAIGKPFSKFSSGYDPQIVSIHPINDEFKLGVINTSADDIELTQRLGRSKQIFSKIRSYYIPKRFLETKTGIKTIGFTVCCNVTITPFFMDEINTDNWYADAIFFEQWFEEKCSRYDDADILRNTARETTILYGTNEKHKPIELFMQALYTMIDSYRYAMERDWSGNGLFFTAVITAGDKTDFVFSKDRYATINMFGEAFQKQMKLRENLLANSVIICDKCAEMFMMLKLGNNLKQIDTTAYYISLDQNEFDRSSELYQ